MPTRCSLRTSRLMRLQAFDKSGPYIRMLVEIVKAIRWFMLMMLISILATWNSFMLLLKRQAACPEPGADASCEANRDAASVFRTMYDMINTLLFGNGNLDSLFLSVLPRINSLVASFTFPLSTIRINSLVFSLSGSLG